MFTVSSYSRTHQINYGVLDVDGDSTVAVIPVSNPPAPCPCVVRVSTTDFDQIAVTPIVVTGHETSDLVDSGQRAGAIEASISAIITSARRPASQPKVMCIYRTCQRPRLR